MTLPASGAISIGNVMDEIRLASPTSGLTYPLTLGSHYVRWLAGKPTGPISLTDLYGKSNVYHVDYDIPPATYSSGTLNLIIATDGGVYKSGSYSGGSMGATKVDNWYLPNTANIGNSFWVKFRQVGGPSAGVSAGGTYDSWMPLTVAQQINLGLANEYDPSPQTLSIQVHISTSASDANIVSDHYYLLRTY